MISLNSAQSVPFLAFLTTPYSYSGPTIDTYNICISGGLLVYTLTAGNSENIQPVSACQNINLLVTSKRAQHQTVYLAFM